MFSSGVFSCFSYFFQNFFFSPQQSKEKVEKFSTFLSFLMPPPPPPVRFLLIYRSRRALDKSAVLVSKHLRRLRLKEKTIRLLLKRFQSFFFLDTSRFRRTELKKKISGFFKLSVIFLKKQFLRSKAWIIIFRPRLHKRVFEMLRFRLIKSASLS